MADILLFHHAQGRTDGVIAFADELRAAGHRVTAPDLYDGDAHLVTDRSLDAWDPDAAALAMERTLAFLAALP